MKEVFLLILNYSINFHDSDYGDCNAGDGKEILGAYKDAEKVNSIITEWNPVIKLAEKESIVWPIQPNNLKLKKFFDITLHDINDGYNFHLTLKEMSISL
jgi:hypothetical protein